MLCLQGILLALFLGSFSTELILERVGRVQLPIDKAPDGTDLICWNMDLAEEVVYDSADLAAYVGGEQIITVVDIQNPAKPEVLDRVDLQTPIADIQICGKYVAAVAYNSISDALDGQLLIYSTYDAKVKAITPLNNFTICSEPDHLIFTPDCSKILVACSGKPGLDANGDYINPEGKVAIIDATDIETADSIDWGSNLQPYPQQLQKHPYAYYLCSFPPKFESVSQSSSSSILAVFHASFCDC
eukprot:TRINITY_DN9483_c0_g1_i1.p1 TRINITY_DN9483_c0_g1~~TRINITY_DN9483_c0_g1_i1.p1  ORF type:complete len:244 (-),score=40.45 TRINITY_DN9483_c0_g1_i1:317-1048(-)